MCSTFSTAIPDFLLANDQNKSTFLFEFSFELAQNTIKNKMLLCPDYLYVYICMYIGKLFKLNRCGAYEKAFACSFQISSVYKSMVAPLKSHFA